MYSARPKDQLLELNTCNSMHALYFTIIAADYYWYFISISYFQYSLHESLVNGPRKSLSFPFFRLYKVCKGLYLPKAETHTINSSYTYYIKIPILLCYFLTN